MANGGWWSSYQCVVPVQRAQCFPLLFQGPSALLPLDVSLPQHTWFKWISPYQIWVVLNDELIIWIRCAGSGNIWNMQGKGALGRGLKNTAAAAPWSAAETLLALILFSGLDQLFCLVSHSNKSDSVGKVSVPCGFFFVCLFVFLIKGWITKKITHKNDLMCAKALRVLICLQFIWWVWKSVFFLLLWIGYILWI